jgi:hypothetical protein
MNIEFRWLVIEEQYRDWDSRWGEYKYTTVKKLPVLQFRHVIDQQTATEWQSVPTVVEHVLHYDLEI